MNGVLDFVARAVCVIVVLVVAFCVLVPALAVVERWCEKGAAFLRLAKKRRARRREANERIARRQLHLANCAACRIAADPRAIETERLESLLHSGKDAR